MMCLLHSELGRVSPQWVSYVARNLSGQLCQKTLDHRLWFSYIYYIYNTHLCQLIGFDFHIIHIYIYIYIYLYICIDRFALQKYVVGVCVYCSISPCIFDIYIYMYSIYNYIYMYIHIFTMYFDHFWCLVQVNFSKSWTRIIRASSPGRHINRRVWTAGTVTKMDLVVRENL